MKTLYFNFDQEVEPHEVYTDYQSRLTDYKSIDEDNMFECLAE
ncbi:hypothetical protein HNQ55_001603 [Thalassotalea piscium]|uniref:Uncharacterized protein n=1 Tax=Thalassotalea piscium TaxID=1230533 RepID=A0A7X0NGW6_9GAMM|nr:hypothetical protein [Thalassotalea piscium]